MSKASNAFEGLMLASEDAVMFHLMDATLAANEALVRQRAVNDRLEALVSDLQELL